MNDMPAIQREEDIALVERRARGQRLDVLVDGVADVFFERVRGIAIERAEPPKGAGDVELNGNALRHAVSLRPGRQCSTVDRWDMAVCASIPGYV
ncbi:MAG: hypothetical protein ACRD96_05330 [Bryobacteraceae bacterium]